MEKGTRQDQARSVLFVAAGIVLVVVCVAALTTMVRVATRPTPGQVLRIDED